MDFDTILYIFQLSDSFTKIPFSLSNKIIHEKSRQYIQSIKTAIKTSDIFSIIQNNKWYRYITVKQLGLIGSEFLILKYQQYNLIDNNILLYGVCQGGHIKIVKLMIESNTNNWNYGLQGACQGGHIEIVELMIERGANDWDHGLYKACRGGHIEIIKRMIERGANNWNYGLYGACSSGYIEIVKLMIEYGASGYNHGFYEACGSGNIGTVKLMIEYGADNWNSG